ncbi:MAG: ornithine cyclodeaminase family protein [Candidatus Dormibacteraeota bacterium]|nr:ornithine cyclodeaminase family protein [Candidatus Dormibacteraeota bacterium]
MDVLVLSAADVMHLLPMRDCIRVVREALAALARGKAIVPLRTVMRLPDGSGFLGVMPGYLGSDEGREAALGMKAVCVFPGNSARGIDTHQGAVVLFDQETGQLAALMDGATVTAIRTAAVSGVATDLLARKDAGALAILGAGVQARTHLEAIGAVRNLTKVRVWSRDPGHVARFVKEARGTYRGRIDAAGTAEEAVRGADIVVTVTASPQPIISRAWIKDDAHINAVGASIPTAREIDSETMTAARLFVDRRESALNEAGDVLIPMREGAFGPDHIEAELGEVIIGKHAGRRSSGELTLFKSLGIAVEDVATAAYIVARAKETGVGQKVTM